MLVATKLMILLHWFAALPQPIQLTDIMATPLIFQHYMRDVTGSHPAARYELNVYCSSAGCLQLLTNIHVSHKSAFCALSRPCKLMLT